MSVALERGEVKYRIIGANRETGDDVELVLDAPTPGAAQAKANDMGIVVEAVSGSSNVDLQTLTHPGRPETLATSTGGAGCPRCGSHKLTMKRHTPAVAWGLLVAGLVSSLFTCGLGLILCIVAFFIIVRRGHCRACGWSWRI